MDCVVKTAKHDGLRGFFKVSDVTPLPRHVIVIVSVLGVVGCLYSHRTSHRHHSPAHRGNPQLPRNVDDLTTFATSSITPRHMSFDRIR